VNIEISLWDLRYPADDTNGTKTASSVMLDGNEPEEAAAAGLLSACCTVC